MGRGRGVSEAAAARGGTDALWRAFLTAVDRFRRREAPGLLGKDSLPEEWQEAARWAFEVFWKCVFALNWKLKQLSDLFRGFPASFSLMPAGTGAAGGLESGYRCRWIVTNLWVAEIECAFRDSRSGVRVERVSIDALVEAARKRRPFSPVQLVCMLETAARYRDLMRAVDEMAAERMRTLLAVYERYREDAGEFVEAVGASAVLDEILRM